MTSPILCTLQETNVFSALLCGGVGKGGRSFELGGRADPVPNAENAAWIGIEGVNDEAIQRDLRAPTILTAGSIGGRL